MSRLPWLEGEFGWSEVTAWRFMNVAEKFPNFGNLDIAPSALYLLASPAVSRPKKESPHNFAPQAESKQAQGYKWGLQIDPQGSTSATDVAGLTGSQGSICILNIHGGSDLLKLLKYQQKMMDTVLIEFFVLLWYRASLSKIRTSRSLPLILTCLLMIS